MFLDLGIQHAMTKRHTVICDMPGFTVFSTLSHSQKHELMNEREEKLVEQHN